MCALWMTQTAISSSIEHWNTAKILLPTGQWQTSIQPFSIHLTTSPLHSGPRGLVTPIPAGCPVHHAATQKDKQPLALTHFDNSEFPIRLSSICLDRGRRMEYPHADAGTTCTHAKTPWPGIEPTTFPLRGDGTNHCTMSLQLQVNNLFPINNTIRSRLQ